MVCGENQCNKVTISMLPVNTLFHWQKCMHCFACRLAVNISEYLLFFKHYFHVISREAKACQTKQGNIFCIFFISRISMFQASQALLCGYMDLNETLFFREQTTALPSPCEWDWEHSCTSSPKHSTAGRQRHSKIVTPPKVPVKLHQLDLAISLKLCILVMWSLRCIFF